MSDEKMLHQLFIMRAKGAFANLESYITLRLMKHRLSKRFPPNKVFSTTYTPVNDGHCRIWSCQIFGSIARLKGTDQDIQALITALINYVFVGNHEKLMQVLKGENEFETCFNPLPINECIRVDLQHLFDISFFAVDVLQGLTDKIRDDRLKKEEGEHLLSRTTILIETCVSAHQKRPNLKELMSAEKAAEAKKRVISTPPIPQNQKASVAN